MSLSDLESLGSFVSGFAVLVSLVFLYFQLRQLGLQVKQAEKNQVASIGQTRATRVVDFLMRRATSPQFADAVRKGSWGHDDISLTELAQFRSFIQATYLSNRDSFQRHREGLLSEDDYAAFVRGVAEAISQPGFRAMTQRFVRGRDDDFSRFFARIIADTPLVQEGDELSQWRDELVAVRAAAAT